MPPSGRVPARLASSPNVTMDQRLFSFLKPLQWIRAGEVISKHKRISRRCSRYFSPAAEGPHLALRHSPVRLLVVFALGDRLC